MTKLKKIICLLFGHDCVGNNDSGFQVCHRCKKHEYYDYDTFYKSGYIWFFKTHIGQWIYKINKYRNRNKLPF